MDTKSAYKILKIEESSSIAEIKKAYRKQAMKYHPDKYSNFSHQAWATHKFIEINEAYKILESLKISNETPQNQQDIQYKDSETTENLRNDVFDKSENWEEQLEKLKGIVYAKSREFFKNSNDQDFKTDSKEKKVNIFDSFFNLWEILEEKAEKYIFTRILYLLLSFLLGCLFLPGIFGFLLCTMIIMFFITFIEQIGLEIGPDHQNFLPKFLFLIISSISYLLFLTFVSLYLADQNFSVLLNYYLLISLNSIIILFIISETIGFVITIYLRRSFSKKLNESFPKLL